jgi:hypothetical protein
LTVENMSSNFVQDGQRQENSFSLDDDNAEDFEGGPPAMTPVPAAAGSEPPFSPNGQRLADQLNGGVDFAGGGGVEGDQDVARRALAGLMAANVAVPEEATRASRMTSRSGTSTYPQKGVGPRGPTTSAATTIDDMTMDELREALRAQRAHDQVQQTSTGPGALGSAFPAGVGNSVNLDRAVRADSPHTVNNAQAYNATFGGPAAYARQAAKLQQQAAEIENNRRYAVMHDQQQQFDRQNAPAPTTDQSTQLLTFLTAMMAEQSKRGSKSSKLKSVTEQLKEFSADAVTLGGSGVSDITRWIALTKESAGSLTVERGFMTKVRSLMINETSSDYDSKTKDQDGRTRTGTGTDYLHRFIQTVGKQEYRKCRAEIEAAYKLWKGWEDKEGSGGFDASAMMAAFGNPEVAMQMGQSMSNPHAFPDYTPCFETFCKILVQSDYVLLADQHRWAFPPLDEPNLRWQAYKPAVSKSGNKSGKAAVPADTW